LGSPAPVPAVARQYDLEERTWLFARAVREFVAKLPRTLANSEDVKQLIRSSGSIGANYIEANEALGKKDFLMKVKICRKEAKESNFWLRLLSVGTDERLEKERQCLAKEAKELELIFGAMLRNVQTQ
jgi:four helix bundle protein